MIRPTYSEKKVKITVEISDRISYNRLAAKSGAAVGGAVSLYRRIQKNTEEKKRRNISYFVLIPRVSQWSILVCIHSITSCIMKKKYRRT